MSKDKLENELVVSNLTEEDQAETKIYEYIPKEVAPSAKDLKFDAPSPQIIEDDPLIMWDLGPLQKRKKVVIKYSTLPRLERTQCVEKGYEADVAKYNLNPYVFDDCYKYFGIKFEEAVERNKKIREEREKDNVELIDKDDRRYQPIQRQAKGLVGEKEEEPQKLSPKISREEAVAVIKEKFGAAQDKECEAAFAKGDNGWRVVCSRQNYWVGPEGKYGTFYEFNYQFFFVAADGKTWTSKGEYARWQRDEGKEVRTFGQPLWGSQIVDKRFFRA